MRRGYNAVNWRFSVKSYRLRERNLRANAGKWSRKMPRSRLSDSKTHFFNCWVCIKISSGHFVITKARIPILVKKRVSGWGENVLCGGMTT